MVLSTLRSLMLLSVLVVVAACSDPDPVNPTPPTPDGSTTSPDGSTTLPDGETPLPDSGTNDGNAGDGNVDATCIEYAQLECNRNRDCFPVFLDWTYGSYDACLTQAKDACRVWSSLPGSSLTAPGLVACLRAYSAAGCGAEGPFTECRSLPGDLANGGGCHLNDQCGSGYCRRSGTNDCGACADKLAPGAACDKASDCQSGRCSAGLCEPILKEGEPCPSSTDCLGDLICDEGVCKKVTVVGEGQACSGTNVCGLYMTCAGGRCFKDVVVDIGQRCGEMVNAGFAFCRNGDCNAQSLCVNRPAIGGACSADGSCVGTGVCFQGQCRALTSDVCDVPPRDIVVRDLADEIGRAALMGRLGRARPGGIQRPGG